MPDSRYLHEAIREAADPLAIMDRIVAQALVLVPAADGASFEVPRDGETLEYVSVAGTLGEHMGLRLPMAASLSGLAARTGAVVRTDNAASDPRVNREAVRRTGVVSMMCVPVRGGHGGTSVLKVSSRRPDAFSDMDVATLELLAGFMGSTLAAASDLASVTADLLHQAQSVPGSSGEALGTTSAIARFVANVMSPGMVEDAEASQRIGDLVAGGGLRVVVQPIVALTTGEVIAFEALARFPGDLLRTPDRWFADARRAGRVVDLELLALREALALLPSIPEDVHLAVNVGPETILDERCTMLLQDAPLERLTLELTEHQHFTDYRRLVAAANGLRHRGALLSIDDTGTGYSSLTHILRMQPDVIKLDRDLVIGIEDDLVRQSLAAALVSFAAGLGASVVAEGIETQAAADRLLELGVRYGQGFLLGRPEPVTAWRR